MPSLRPSLPAETDEETTMAAMAITGLSTMRDVLEAYASAQRALFQRDHIGGCNSCRYQPDDRLEEVARRHNIFDADEVIAFVEHAEQIDGSRPAPRHRRAGRGLRLLRAVGPQDGRPHRVWEFPMRVKCATLAWHARRGALEADGARASTE